MKSIPKIKDLDKTGTYGKETKRIANIGLKVFLLESEYLYILRFFAQNNLQKRREWDVVKSHPDFTRKIVHNRIWGTSKLNGLINDEYIIKNELDKKTFNKEQVAFRLRLKGIIASLGSDTLQETEEFKEYFKIISEMIDDKKVIHLVEYFITYQILVFMHHSSFTKIILTHADKFASYYKSIVEKEDLYDFISQNYNDGKTFKEFRNDYGNYFAAKTLLQENIQKDNSAYATSTLTRHDEYGQMTYEESTEFYQKQSIYEAVFQWYEVIDHTGKKAEAKKFEKDFIRFNRYMEPTFITRQREKLKNKFGVK